MEKGNELPPSCGECSFYEVFDTGPAWMGECRHPNVVMSRVQIEFDRPFYCPLANGLRKAVYSICPSCGNKETKQP